MTRTERIDKILQQTIEGDNLDVLMNGLSGADQNLFYDLVAELRAGGDLDLEDLWKIDYTRRPPTMEEFLDEPYWLGDITKHTDENQGIFPAWKEILCRDFNLDSRLHNVVITGSLGVGKCLGPGTLIRMFDGSLKTVETVKQGDRVMGDDGTPRNVVSTCSGQEEMFSVNPHRPIGGLNWSCNASHKLVTQFHGKRRVTSAKAIFESTQQAQINHKLVRTGFDLPAVSVPIDPYWLGLWIGDGDVREPTLVIHKQDHEILSYHTAYAESLGMRISVRNPDDIAPDYAAIRTLGTGAENSLGGKLRLLGLHGSREHHHEKFIPASYLQNDRRTRLAVLAGLIDTDGCRCRNGCYELTFASERLARDTQNLAWSLGYSCSWTKRTIHNPVFKAPATAYHMIVGGAYDVPVLVARKKSMPKVSNRVGGNRRSHNITGFKLRSVGAGDYFGFTVDGNHQFLLADGTITHNSWNAAAIICYRIVLCRLLRNPYGFLGLSKGSPVVFALLSVTKSAVHDTIFGDVMNFMAHSPFFTEECKFDIEKKYANLKIPLGNDLVLTAGSQGQHVLGRNTLAVAMDEGNWRREANPDEKAYKLYDDIRQRITNRFQKIAGFLPAVCILASSARDESSFTEQVITDINAANDPRTQRVYRLAAFEVKRHLLTLKPRWFKVAFGLKTTAPRILKGWYREDGTTLEVGDDIPPGARVRLVPEDYLPDFKRNVITSLQSICGESTGGAFRLFSDFSIVEMAVTAAEAAGLVNPCTIDQVPLSNDDKKEMWDFLEPHSNFVQRQLGRFQPKRDPGQPRYAHYDLATVNQAGLAICHVAGRKLVDGLYDAASGKVFAQYRPIIEYDFILAIVPGEQKEISLIKIQNFLFWLRDRCGYSFGMVTADSFQCVDGATPINTSRGIIHMIEVKIGDVVNSRAGPRPVVGKISYKGVPKLKLTGYDGETLIGTPNHRVWAAKSDGRDLSKQKLAWGWIQLDQLQPGDALAMSYSCVEATNEVELPALPNVLPGSRNPQQSSNWPVPSTLTEDVAEVLGLFWGDGCTSGNNISICSSEADFQDLLAAWTRLGWKVSTVNRRRCPIVHSNSPRLARWWKACGFTKSPQKGKQPGREVGLPEAILRSPKRVQAAFLRGLFSADGSVDQYGGVSLSTKHKKLAELVQMLLRTGWSIPSHITSFKRPFKKGGRLFKGYVLSLRGCRTEFCSQIGFCYKTKQNKLVSKLHHKGRKLYSTVKSVERVDDGDVYDIQVEGDPSYVSNGFMSHNSQMPLELLQTNGFEVDILSMDRTKDPYYSWRNGFSENLIRMFRQPILMDEAEKLQDLQKKIEHPSPGSKDVADACAGAYYNALRLGLGSIGVDGAVPDFWSAKDADAIKPPIEMKTPEDKIPVHSFEG